MNGEQKRENEPERPNFEFRLRERERFLRTLIGNLPGVVFRCRGDAEFTKEFLSDGCFDLPGYLAEELIGANVAATWDKLMHPEDWKRVLSDVRRIIEDEQPNEARQFQVSYRLIPRAGQPKHARDRFRFIRDSSGKVDAFEGFITDVTEQTLADERVRESENRYKLLAENMHDLVCLHELDGKYLYVSPSSETLLGYTPDEMIATPPYDLVHAEDVERLRDDAHAALLSGETKAVIVEYRMRDKKGEYCWFETMAQTVVAPDGTIVQLQTVSRDVSERKQVEIEMRKAQEELAQLLMSEQEARRDADAARVEVEHASRASQNRRRQ